MKSVVSLLRKYHVGVGWIDPFAGENSPAEITNDIEGHGAKHQMDGLDFLKSLPSRAYDGCLFDPPYSVEQCLRRYTPKRNGTVGRAEYCSACRNEIARVLKKGAHAISFGWDSNGIGRRRGFEVVEILLVCHGACHNDTIITVDAMVQEKVKDLDWPAIQSYYDEGHPWSEMIEEFGITKNMLREAKELGLFKSRSRSEARRSYFRRLLRHK
jgi:hypothetical protein